MGVKIRHYPITCVGLAGANLTRKPKQLATANQIRIIGGEWRGRKLSFPSVDGLRPTGDRIRETLFNWLAQYIEGKKVLDLFAGSGALGLEALSRGAKSAIFVEPDRRAYASLTESLALLAAEKRCEVLETTAEQFLSSAKPESVDLLFFDPPFAKNLHRQLAEEVDQSGILSKDALIYVESSIHAKFELPHRWIELKSKTAGEVQYRLLQLDCDKPLI